MAKNAQVTIKIVRGETANDDKIMMSFPRKGIQQTKSLWVGGLSEEVQRAALNSGVQRKLMSAISKPRGEDGKPLSWEKKAQLMLETAERLEAGQWGVYSSDKTDHEMEAFVALIMELKPEAGETRIRAWVESQKPSQIRAIKLANAGRYAELLAEKMNSGGEAPDSDEMLAGLDDIEEGSGESADEEDARF